MGAELKIKVCGMRDPANIREVVKFKPDLVGFIFYPGSKRYMGDPDTAWFRAVPGNIGKVGVFVNETVEKIKQKAADLCLDLVQLHGTEPPEDCRILAESGVPVIKAFGISGSPDNERLREYSGSCEYFLFDTGSAAFGGTGKKFDWHILEEYKLAKPFFLSGGIGPEDLSSILNLDHPALAGIDINSRFETEPGIKDTAKVRDFIQSIRRK